MAFRSLEDDLNQIIDKYLMVNSTVGEMSVIRGTIFRLWGQVFSDKNSHKVLVDPLDKLDWNKNLDNLKNFILGLDTILTDISNLVESNQTINYLDLRTRLTWLVNFMDSKVGKYVRASQIRLRTVPGFASMIILYKDLDFTKLSFLDMYDSENITAVNLYADFDQDEIPKNWIEEIIKVK